MNLKNTVEEQIDVILKLEDQRKALVRQNKVYKQKNKQLTSLLNKYNTKPQSQDAETSTYQVILIDISTQTQPQCEPVSQLDQAKQLLNCLNKTQLKINYEKEKQDQSSIQILQTTSKKHMNSINDQQLLSSQLVKMTKQINSLRKDLKDSLKIIKTKEQQNKQMKKCLDLKTDLLQKARSDFNDLSKLVNTDKYKSIRTLQQQSTKNREGLKSALQQNKILKFEQQKVHSLNQKLRLTLQKLTNEYDNYKQTHSRDKQQSNQTMQTMKTLMSKYREQAKEYQNNQKHLLQSIRKCQCKIE